VQEMKTIDMVKMILVFVAPKLAKLLKVQIIDTQATEFFVSIFRETMEFRKTNNVRRNDLIDLMLDAMTTNASPNNEETDNTQYDRDAMIKPKTKMHFSESEIELAMVSNALILFLAGFDTSSTIQAITMHFLAKTTAVQDQLLDEIKETIDMEGTEHLSYSAIHGMSYLDMVIHEALRHYMLTILERNCSKDYIIPDTDVVIKKGMLVQIAAGAIMKDPQFFANPQQFNPLNFSADEKENRNPYAFLAFGQGPRNCIGMRFALLNVKIAIIRLVNRFKLVTNEKTPNELVVNPKSQSLLPKGGLSVSVVKR
jgi:cytochrome P450 family 6